LNPGGNGRIKRVEASKIKAEGERIGGMEDEDGD
jgi:hypothetical protein